MCSEICYHFSLYYTGFFLRQLKYGILSRNKKMCHALKNIFILLTSLPATSSKLEHRPFDFSGWGLFLFCKLKRTQVKTHLSIVLVRFDLCIWCCVAITCHVSLYSFLMKKLKLKRLILPVLSFGDDSFCKSWAAWLILIEWVKWKQVIKVQIPNVPNIWQSITDAST